MIVYIITKLELGGAQKVCLQLFEQLALPTMLISGNEGTLAPHVQNNPNVILLDSFKREVSLKLVWAELKTFVNLVRQLRTLKKQHSNLIVHTHSTKAGLVGRWAAFFAGIKTRVHTVHGYGFHDHQSWFVWTPIYLLELVTSFITTHYVCVSGADVATGKKLFPRFNNKHSIIRASVDTHKFVPATRTNNSTFVFGTTSCLKPQKNLLDLIKAFEIVYARNPNTRLEIVGDGVQRPLIEQAIKERNLQTAVTLHGWVSPVAPVMATWDCFVMSSLWEGLPCAVVEARLMKLPVISYDTGGIYEVIKSGVNGYLVPQKDWPALGQAMLRVSQDRTLQSTLASHHDSLSDFQVQTMVAQHQDLYGRLTG